MIRVCPSEFMGRGLGWLLVSTPHRDRMADLWEINFHAVEFGSRRLIAIGSVKRQIVHDETTAECSNPSNLA